ncbi:cupin domain-containing protein [Bacillus piscicola]|uniref:cupin domain-containing protein n=1 Tax=Bacillus piscicola TaxID=1632684 RepID=UPI001F09AB24|nr:cupin domain-containing protein [Bacillus piscicola]
MNEPKRDMMSYKEFLEKSKKPYVRPHIWKWKDIEAKLQESLSEDFMGDGRGTIALVHEDTGESYGVSPTMNMVAQIFEPGERNKPHRHTNLALSIIVKGEGYSIIDGEKVEWEAGDVFIASPWSEHEHCNTSETEQALFYTIQDVPVVSKMGTWFRESPIGAPKSHIIKNQDKENS